MITTLTLDKRLRDKQLRSGELSQEELVTHLGQLPDLSENVRFRKTEAELAAEAAEAAEAAKAAEVAEATEAAEGVVHEQVDN